MSKFLLLALLSTSLFAQPADRSTDRWKDLRFIVGDWVGEGGGNTTGQGAGAYSFVPELGGKVLVRRNVADYPGNPPIHHEDVMTIYLEAPDGKNGKAPEAIYFDSEGHVIHYAIEIDPAGKTVRFLSPAQPGQPRYRLTYRETGKDLVAGQFEVAPPGKPEEFKKYMEWTARRKK